MNFDGFFKKGGFTLVDFTKMGACDDDLYLCDFSKSNKELIKANIFLNFKKEIYLFSYKNLIFSSILLRCSEVPCKINIGLNGLFYRYFDH